MIIQGWGRRIPEDKLDKVTATWGARGIFRDKFVDLLPDRQTWSLADFSEDDADPTSCCFWDRKAAMKPLSDWIDKKGLPFIREQAKALYTDENRTISLDEGKFHVEANPQSSFGYLYIRAWEEK